MFFHYHIITINEYYTDKEYKSFRNYVDKSVSVLYIQVVEVTTATKRILQKLHLQQVLLQYFLLTLLNGIQNGSSFDMKLFFSALRCTRRNSKHGFTTCLKRFTGVRYIIVNA